MFMVTTSAVIRTNREKFAAVLDRLAHGENAPVALALMDIDNFRAVNDDFGHDVGDRVLAAWERTLSGSVPEDAVVARLGGDEYVVALPGLSAESALVVCEEIRRHFASHRVRGVDRDLDASVGVAALPAHAATGGDLLDAAGSALMRAKREGRGRSAIYVDEKMVHKTTYYQRAALDRLARLAAATGRTEAKLLREALDDLLEKHRSEL